MRTCSKTQRYLIVHNFFDFDRNISILHLIMTVLVIEIQLNKNLWNLSYPVLTTTQNDEKLHIFDSNSLVIVSIWTYHTWREMYRWDECNWTEIVETCNENMQQNWEIFDYSQLLNIDHNVGMLHLKMIVLMREIQLNKNLWNLSYQFSQLLKMMKNCTFLIPIL